MNRHMLLEKRALRISGKYAFVIFIAGLIPFAALTAYSIYVIQTSIADANKQLVAGIGREYSERIDSWIDGQLALAALIGQQKSGHAAIGIDWKDSLRRSIPHIQTLDPVFTEGIWVVELGDGRAIERAVRLDDGAEHVGTTRWALQPQMSGKEGLSVEQVPVADGMVPQLFFSAPIYRGERMIAVFAISFSMRKIEQFLVEGSSVELGSAEALVVDERGQVLANMRGVNSSFEGAQLGAQLDSGLAAQFSSAGMPFILFEGTHATGAGTRWAAVANKLRHMPWRLIYLRPEGEFFASVSQKVKAYSFVAGLLLLLLVLIGYLSGRVIGGRFMQMAQASQRLAEGDLSARVSGGSGDEWGLLVNTFNRMADQLKRRTDALELAKQEAERASRAKSEFLGVMSHEIRTPLNAVISYSRMLSEDRKLGAQHRTTVGVVHRSGQRLLELVNDLLDFSRIESGKITVQNAPVDTVDLLSDILEMVGKRAWESGLEIVIEPLPGVPELFHGDATKLQQILNNLVGNALKFTREGGVCIQVAWYAGAEAGAGDIEFTVSDSGEGIPESLRPHLFEPFRQADSSNTRKYGGAGLGLAISQRLALAMGGSLEEVGVAGGGAVFKLRIPAVVPDSKYLDWPEAKVSKRNYKLLSGNAVTASYYRRVLAHAGFRAVEEGQYDFVVYEVGTQHSAQQHSDLTTLAARGVHAVVLNSPEMDMQAEQQAVLLNVWRQIDLLRPVLPWELIAAVESLVDQG